MPAWRREGPLIGVAELFELGEPDVVIDPLDDEIQQHDDRQRVGEADEREAAGNRQSLEDARHGRTLGKGRSSDDASAGTLK